ncbi:MAG: transcription/translation regulatory transformer protein RfaH [Oxalobacter sp.]|nr:MAG: transcription/translation regulatory transformer protein RfaH [Oxalobacter sp.]
MNWYLIHTKPRQEKSALLNLDQQGYECYLPLLPTEKIRQGIIAIVDEPLFPRYIFIRLGRGETAKSWSPIRSTKGVSRLVSFGNEPAKVDDKLVEMLRSRENVKQKQPLRIFNTGDYVTVTEGPFVGIEAIYQMSDGEGRVMVLIELLSKRVKMSVEVAKLRKVG